MINLSALAAYNVICGKRIKYCIVMKKSNHGVIMKWIKKAGSYFVLLATIVALTSDAFAVVKGFPVVNPELVKDSTSDTAPESVDDWMHKATEEIKHLQKTNPPWWRLANHEPLYMETQNYVAIKNLMLDKDSFELVVFDKVSGEQKASLGFSFTTLGYTLPKGEGSYGGTNSYGSISISETDRVLINIHRDGMEYEIYNFNGKLIQNDTLMYKTECTLSPDGRFVAVRNVDAGEQSREALKIFTVKDKKEIPLPFPQDFHAADMQFLGDNSVLLCVNSTDNYGIVYSKIFRYDLNKKELLDSMTITNDKGEKMRYRDDIVTLSSPSRNVKTFMCKESSLNYSQTNYSTSIIMAIITVGDNDKLRYNLYPLDDDIYGGCGVPSDEIIVFNTRQNLNVLKVRSNAVIFKDSTYNIQTYYVINQDTLNGFSTWKKEVFRLNLATKKKIDSSNDFVVKTIGRRKIKFDKSQTKIMY